MTAQLMHFIKVLFATVITFIICLSLASYLGDVSIFSSVPTPMLTLIKTVLMLLLGFTLIYWLLNGSGLISQKKPAKFEALFK